MGSDNNFNNNANGSGSSSNPSGGLVGLLLPNRNRFLLFGILSMVAISSNTMPIVYLSLFSNLLLLLYLHGRALHINAASMSITATGEAGVVRGRVVIWQDLVLAMALLLGSSFSITTALGSAMLVLPPSIVLFTLFSRGVYNLFIPLLVAGFAALLAFYGSLLLYGYDDLIDSVASYISVDALAVELGIGVDAVYNVLRIVINMAVVFNGVTYMYVGGLLYSSLLATGRVGFWLGLGYSRGVNVTSSSVFLFDLSRNQSYALLSAGLVLFFMATKIPVIPPMLAYALLAVPISIFFYIGLDTLRGIIFVNRPYALPKIFILILLSIMGFMVVIGVASLFIGILSVWMKFDRWVAQGVVVGGGSGYYDADVTDDDADDVVDADDVDDVVDADDDVDDDVDDADVTDDDVDDADDDADDVDADRK